MSFVSLFSSLSSRLLCTISYCDSSVIFVPCGQPEEVDASLSSHDRMNCASTGLIYLYSSCTMCQEILLSNWSASRMLFLCCVTYTQGTWRSQVPLACVFVASLFFLVDSIGLCVGLVQGFDPVLVLPDRCGICSCFGLSRSPIRGSADRSGSLFIFSASYAFSCVFFCCAGIAHWSANAWIVEHIYISFFLLVLYIGVSRTFFHRSICAQGFLMFPFFVYGLLSDCVAHICRVVFHRVFDLLNLFRQQVLLPNLFFQDYCIDSLRDNLHVMF